MAILRFYLIYTILKGTVMIHGVFPVIQYFEYILSISSSILPYCRTGRYWYIPSFKINLYSTYWRNSGNLNTRYSWYRVVPSIEEIDIGRYKRQYSGWTTVPSQRWRSLPSSTLAVGSTELQEAMLRGLLELGIRDLKNQREIYFLSSFSICKPFMQ